jgi:hypothetical protein
VEGTENEPRMVEGKDDMGSGTAIIGSGVSSVFSFSAEGGGSCGVCAKDDRWNVVPPLLLRCLHCGGARAALLCLSVGEGAATSEANFGGGTDRRGGHEIG